MYVVLKARDTQRWKLMGDGTAATEERGPNTLLDGGIVLGGGCLMTILPYVPIVKTVQKLQHSGNKSKVFSTCSSHLSVVFIFYRSLFFNYFRPSGSHNFASEKVVPVFYAVILLNPLIYSLRIQDFKIALRRAVMNMISTIQNIFAFF